MEIIQYHSETQLKEDCEAYQHSEIRGHVDVAHVVEAQHLLAVACAQLKSTRQPLLDFDTVSHKKTCSRGY